MAYIPQNSILATQGTVPWSVLGAVTNVGSVISVPSGNQSVSGTVQVDVRASVGTVIIGGSILTTTGNSSVQVLNFPANQSVSGAISVSNFPTTQNVSGSVVATQGTTPWDVRTQPSVAVNIIAGSIAASFTPPENQSVSGTITANQGTTPWIVTGSVQGSFSPVANQSVSGTVQVDVRGSVATVIIGGSVATATTNSSVMLLDGLNAIGRVMGQDAPIASVTGNPVYVGGTDPNGSVIGARAVSVLSVAAGQALLVVGSVSGTVGATQSGTWSTSVMTNVITSIATAGQVMGSVAALQGTNPWVVSLSSIATAGQVIGSVAVLQGTALWNISGSVVAFQGGTQATSISGQVTVVSSLAGGIFPVSGSVAAVVTNTVPVTNVGSIISLNIGSIITVSQGSVAAAVINTPQASVHGAVTFQAASVVTGHGSVNGAASVQVLAAPGAGLYTYVTDFTISNTGSVTTLVTFTDGDGSVMGKTIAPSGGGSNATSLASPMRTLQTNKVVNIVAATATSVLHAWVGGYRAP